jgi:DNA-binding transcriptional regulator YiaG
MNAIKPGQVPAALSQLRAEIEALPKGKSGKRCGISEDLKQRITAARAASQLPVREFSAAVAVSVSSVSNWSKRVGRRKRSKPECEAGSNGFKRMSVVAEAPAPAGRFTIEGPHGMRVTGLGSDDVARLWRALC